MKKMEVRRAMIVNILDRAEFTRKIPESILKKIVKFVIEREMSEKDKDKFKESNLNIILVDENEIQKLNFMFRKENSPTDVLSFSYTDEDEFGEVMICPDVVFKNSISFKIPFFEEFLRVLIHGILHLLGYDHESEENRKVMFEKQEKLLREVENLLLTDWNALDKMNEEGGKLMDKEATFLYIKPDGVERGLVGEVISRIERKGLKIKQLKMIRMSREEALELYKEHEGKDFFEKLIEFVTRGPVVLIVVEGPRAVEAVRNLVGKTDGVKASPGTIRGDFSLSTRENIVHASDSVESAQREMKIFFKESNL